VVDLCFVQPSQGGVTSELLTPAIADAARGLGVDVRTACQTFPDPTEQTIYVISSELLEVIDSGELPDPDQLRRTIVLCSELPGSHLFEVTSRWAQVSGGVLTMHGVPAESFDLGALPAARFDVGYSPLWDRWHGDRTHERRVDVCYASHGVPAEDVVLGHAAQVLDARRIWVSGSFDSPVIHPDVVSMALDSRIQLLPARHGGRFVDSLSVVLSIANGCVVCTSDAVNVGPFEPLRHLCCGTLSSLGFVVESLLQDQDRLAALQRDAYEFVRGEMSIQPSVERLIDVAEAALARANPARPKQLVEHTAELDKESLERGLLVAELKELRVGLKHATTELRRLRRSLSELASRISGETASVSELARTPAYDRSNPYVSVVIPVFNQSSECIEALESLLASTYRNFDVVLVDDASTDVTASMLRSFMSEHAWFPAVLLRHQVNGGPSRARNTGLAVARGELALLLDADNGMYPSGLARLVEALVGEPNALFAYPVLSMLSAERPAGLSGTLPWNPGVLRRGNYIDTLTLVRREELVALGGFREDERLDGWEDWDLWCRAADRGYYGVHVPDVLAWYRKTQHSMLSVAEVDTSVARSLVENAYPRFFAEV
jgi:hypothetical protein